MYHISDNFVASWIRTKNFELPAVIDISCPFCSRHLSFSLTWGNPNENLTNTNTRCTACQKSVIAVLVDFKKESEIDKFLRGKLYIYPKPKVRQPIDGIEEIKDFSEGLEKAYQSAINVFNVREWTASAVLCRRLLEGIAKTLLPEEEQNKPLYKQIQSLPAHRDLRQPILTMADAIRLGGNLGAHFDWDKEPNEETVTLMLELLDYLIEYLFILPERVERLHTAINELGVPNPLDEE